MTVRTVVEQGVLKLVSKSFDVPSQTHIFFHLEPGPMVKGFGDWPDEAFAHFKAQLSEVLNQADKAELEAWSAAFAAYSERRDNTSSDIVRRPWA